MNKEEAEKYIAGISEFSGFFGQNTKKTIWFPKEFFEDDKVYFASRASGDGMTSAGINDGDILVFEVADSLRDGEIGMFVYGKDHKTVCRIFKKYETGAIYLLGDLKREPIRVDNYDDFHIGGKLVGIYKAVQRKQASRS